LPSSALSAQNDFPQRDDEVNKMAQKVAYVTGGMGGIGTAICQRLHKEGFKVIAGCGPTRDFEKWLGEQKALGYAFHASVGNVGDWDSTVDAFSKAKSEHGSIDVLVNNAGITRDRMFLKMTREDWDAVIETNLNSMFNVTKQVVGDMVEKGWGRIVNISSVNGEKGQAGQTNYSAAKAGMHGFSMALAQELGQQGRDGQHGEPRLHRHRHGQGDPPGRAGQDRRHDPGQAPGRAERDRLHHRLAGG
jgi:acetoacetyl-CoA reductase